jgi:flagellar hook-associated protein FlgK
MSLNLALNNAISGLHLNQQALTVLSQNISNVNTPGYSRQILNQSSLTVEGIGNGVRIEDVTRKIDSYLQRSQQSQSSVASNANMVNDYYDRLQTVLGSPGAQNSIDAYLTGFTNSVQQLASSPDSVASRSNMVNSAQALTTQVSNLAKSIEDLRFQADSDIATVTKTVNTSLNTLHNLNESISKAYALEQSTAGLLDVRDAELQKLAQNMDISVSFDHRGVVSVSSGNGVALVDDIRHQLQYFSAASAEDFYTDKSINPLRVIALDLSGAQVGEAEILMTAGTSDMVESKITGGNLAALQNVRDHLMPDILSQLDQLASRLRDTVNAINNDGSGFPPASSLTGEREVYATQLSDWAGSVRIAAVDNGGAPLPAGYNDESGTGIRALTLDLSTLDSGEGLGKPTIQTIIDEINDHFRAPPVKTVLGGLNNIQLVSDTNTLPSGSPPLFTFDFDTENITRGAANLFVTDITVKDDAGLDITNVTQGPTTVALSTSNTYSTISGSADVDIELVSTSGLAAGERIYLGSPGSAVVTSGINGIAAADVTGYFTIKSIVGNVITITNSSGTLAGGTSSVSDAVPASAISQYDTIDAGENRRTRDTGGQFQVDLSSGINSSYFDVSVNVTTLDSAGAVQTSVITYRVPNGVSHQLNHRYDSIAATGNAQRVVPNTSQSAMRAILVDAQGRELPKQNGVYLDAPGYLKLVSTNSDNAIVIDELDSEQLGDLGGTPSIAASHQAFSHYFGLNNFFSSNAPIATGDTTKGSALNLRVNQHIIDNPNLISTGDLVLQTQPADANGKPQYTYVRYAGDNSIIQKLSAISSSPVSFDAAGGLSATSISLQSYTANFLADISSKSAGAKDSSTNAQSLLDGFNARASSISGVNLDDELAQTITFQNAYAATARIISVVDKMYEALLNLG